MGHIKIKRNRRGTVTASAKARCGHILRDIAATVRPSSEEASAQKGAWRQTVIDLLAAKRDLEGPVSEPGAVD